MEASEKVVESYFRYVEGYFTIPNLRCKGQKEVDLIGMRFSNGSIERIHVEVSVATTGAFSKINAKPFSQKQKKTRNGSASERVKIGYFIEDKFNDLNVVDTLKEFGFENGNYNKILVTWNWEDNVEPIAHSNGITLLKFKGLLEEF